MIRSTFLLLLLALALILTVPTTTFAQKSLSPHIFVGTVMVNGDKPGDGTVITAMVDDQIVGSTTTYRGDVHNGSYQYTWRGSQVYDRFDQSSTNH